MKYALLLLTAILLLVSPAIGNAEQVNYTSMITTWTQKLHPDQTSTFTVKEVIDLGIESTGSPTGELAMWVTLTVGDKTEDHIIILNQKGVTASKLFDPSKTPTESEEGPSCSPEEHAQHHGKDT